MASLSVTNQINTLPLDELPRSRWAHVLPSSERLIREEPVRKTPDPVDVHVGSRIRLRRLLMGITQEVLAEHLRLSFQQVQKYEKGTNRIGAGKLYRIAQILEVPVDFFYQDIGAASARSRTRTADASEDVVEFMTSADGVRLNSAFVRIKDADAKRAVATLISILASD